MKFRLRFLPVVIFAAALLVSVRIGHIWSTVSVEMGRHSVAQRRTEAVRAEALGDLAPAAGGEAKAGAKHPTTGGGEGDVDAGQATESELEVLEALARRRKQLDERERDLDMRAGLLKAAEKRVEQKIAELEAIKKSIEAEMSKKKEEEEEKIRSLVKIYEKMKPKNAARILGKLDLGVLIQVVSRMKEAKTAPILAAMDPEKAKELTVELARRSEVERFPPPQQAATKSMKQRPKKK